MGTTYHTFIGPHLIVPACTVKSTVTKTVCSGCDCDRTGNARFCFKCGSELQRVSNTVERQAPMRLSDELEKLSQFFIPESTLLRPEPGNAHIWLPNLNGSPGTFDNTPRFSANQDELQSLFDRMQNDVARFEAMFAEPLKWLREQPGVEGLKVTWGVVPFYH